MAPPAGMKHSPTAEDKQRTVVVKESAVSPVVAPIEPPPQPPPPQQPPVEVKLYRGKKDLIKAATSELEAKNEEMLLLQQQQQLALPAGVPDEEQRSPSGQQRQRRSTGSKSSTEETQQTEEKIKAILEQAKQEQVKDLMQQQPHLVLPSVPAAVAEDSVDQEAGFIRQQIISQAAAAAEEAAAGYMSRTLASLSPLMRHPGPHIQQHGGGLLLPVNFRPTLQHHSPPMSLSQPTVLTQRQPTPSQQQQQLRPSPPITTSVQLPTQPIPPNEIRSKPKQVLLEPNNHLSSPCSSPMMTVPTTGSSPRSTISLPTQPVPMSLSQHQQRTEASPMPMLPSIPLPRTTAMVSQQQKNMHLLNSTARLPQHPLPPQAPDCLNAAAELRKKEEIAVEALMHTQHLMQHKEYMKPRDAFGGGNHLVQQHFQPHPDDLAKEDKFFPPLSHESLLRLQEAQELYHYYISKGHPEHLALQLSQKTIQDRLQKQERPGSVPLTTLLESYRGQQQVDVYHRQNDSPAPPPAHRPPTSVYLREHLPPPPSESPYAYPPTVHRAAAAYQQQQRPAAIQLSGPTEFTVQNLDSYPVVWQGYLGMKTELATVQFHYVSGCKELAGASLPKVMMVDMPTMPTLRIGQRMRLEPNHLEGVCHKMEQERDHCILLALPCGKDPMDVEEQSKHLRSHFITYLQLKSAAGIVNVSGSEGVGDLCSSYVVHVFPSCDFANNTMAGIAPDLLARVAEIEHMVIVITTTT